MNRTLQDESNESRRVWLATVAVLVAAFGPNKLKRAQIRANPLWIRTGQSCRPRLTQADFQCIVDAHAMRSDCFLPPDHVLGFRYDNRATIRALIRERPLELHVPSRFLGNTKTAAVM